MRKLTEEEEKEGKERCDRFFARPESERMKDLSYAAMKNGGCVREIEGEKEESMRKRWDKS
ncbi:MAG: hypothetical protein R8M45_01295 [Ghiorsea sp.]